MNARVVAAACLAWASFAWSHVAHALPAERVVYAIVIGNNAPPITQPDLPTLRYADDDAVRYYELLRRTAKQSALLTVLDTATQARFPKLAARTETPTLAHLRETLSSFRAAMRADVVQGRAPVLFVTFSGHGAISEAGEPFLALREDNLTRTLLYEEILPSLDDAQVHLIFDACQAGALVGTRGGFDKEIDGTVTALGDENATRLLQQRSLARFANVGALISTAADQEAHEWSRIESGVFTHEVISALLGAADVNGDELIEYSEVQAFIAAANRDVEDPRARPQVIAIPPPLDHRAVLIELDKLQDVTFLRGKAGSLGRFHVELDNGMRWLEAHLDPKFYVNIALPNGTGAHLRTRDKEAALDARRDQDVERLRFTASAEAARGSIDTSYRKSLWKREFGRDYYSGYVDSAGISSVDFDAARARKHAVQERESRDSAVAAFVVAGVAATAAITSSVLALEAKSDFEATTLMRKSHELRSRYETFTAVAIVSGAVALLGGFSGWLLWPSATVDEPGRDTGASVSLHARGTF